MTAALLSLIVSSTPTHGVLAALPAAALPAPASLPITARMAVSVDSPPADDLTADDVGARKLASTAPVSGLVIRGSVPLAVAAVVATPALPAPSHPRRTRSRVVRAAWQPARLWAQLRAGMTVTGEATWYYGTRGYAGVAHVAMPGARFLPRGRTAPRARICAGGRCTTVMVVDACACRAGTRQARLVDISATALRRLGLDPSRGVYQARVTLLMP